MKKVLFYFVLLATLCCFNSCEKPSSDATIKMLLINGEKLEDFDSDISSYEIELTSNDLPKIEVITTSPNATAEITLPEKLPGKAMIEVTAEDGKTKKTYTINFKIIVNSDATLKSIKVGGNELENFDSQIFSYEVVLLSIEQDVPTVEAEATSFGAKVEIKLPQGLPGKVVIDVTSSDGREKKTYTIVLKFAIGKDYPVKAILIDGVELEGFDNSVLSYEVNVSKEMKTSPSVEVITASSDITTEIHLPNPFPGQACIYVKFKDGDKWTERLYTISFVYSYSSDATIQSIIVEGKAIDSVAADIFTYDVELPPRSPNYPSIEVIATSPEARVEIKRNLPDPSSSVGRPKYYPCEVVIDITAEDKKTKNTYIVNITEAPFIVDLTPSGSIDGYDYVDLGLSVKWATYNVGAKSIVEIGDYFAWGEITPYNIALTAKNYDYMFNRCSPDNILSSIFDAVSKNWSKSWRMPTLEEQEELIYNCDWLWVDNLNGSSVSGYYVVSKESNKAIFLPWSSYIPHEDYLNPQDGRTYYWSSWAGLGDQWKDNKGAACMRLIILDSSLDQGGYVASADFMNRADGLCIRGVVGDANEYIPDEGFTLDEAESERQGVSVSGTIAGHTYVDLGLPSRTLWATYNLGASLPSEYGDYYAWGEIETKDYYHDDTYKFYDESRKLTKYCFYNHLGYPDAKSILDPEDNVVLINWGSNWTIPTEEQFMELAKYCSISRKDVYLNGKQIIGYQCKSKINGYVIYIPCAGWEYRDVPNNHMFAMYWSCNLSKDADYDAYCMTIDDVIKAMIISSTMRVQGLSIRPVVKK